MATNFEFYKDAILECARKKSFPTVIHGKVCECSVENCIRCFFNSTNCFAKRVEWLYAEHIEQPKLTKRERAFCEAVQTGWIARCVSNGLWWFGGKPEKILAGTWNGARATRINDLMIGFDFIKPSDNDPWSVEDLLKLEVQEDA